MAIAGHLLTGSTLTVDSGSTLTLSGVLSGTPTSGTLNLSNVTLTLPAFSASVITATTKFVVPAGSVSAPALSFESNYGWIYDSGTHTLSWIRNGANNGDFILNPSGITTTAIICSNVRSGFGLQSDVNLNSFIRCDTGDGNTWRFQTNSVVGLETTTTLVSALLPLKLKNYVVSGLPSAATSGAGSTAFVTDASTTVILGLGLTVVGGGANKVPVYSDGSNWIIG